jgi:DNA-binding LacI/PurR family transcriptional regulator
VLFAANYDLTVGALIAINESGLRLGKDISMVGFDSVELSRVTRPNLTILAQPIDAIAEVAARTMSARIDENEQSSAFTKARIQGTLIVGASVASLHE